VKLFLANVSYFKPLLRSEERKKCSVNIPFDYDDDYHIRHTPFQHKRHAHKSNKIRRKKFYRAHVLCANTMACKSLERVFESFLVSCEGRKICDLITPNTCHKWSKFGYSICLLVLIGGARLEPNGKLISLIKLQKFTNEGNFFMGKILCDL
jgi:hypothetical protein